MRNAGITDYLQRLRISVRIAVQEPDRLSRDLIFQLTTFCRVPRSKRMSEDERKRVVETEDLILAVKRGDVMAFEQLVRQYDKKVLAIALSYCKDAEAAKDIYQEVFIRVYKAIPSFRFQSQFSTWLYRITANVCLTHRARRREESKLRSLDEPFRQGTDGLSIGQTLQSDEQLEERTFQVEVSERVRKAMGSLSPQQRLVFSLRHYQGYKLKEIAALMDCAEGTVKKYLFTATEKMRELMKDVAAESSGRPMSLGKGFLQ
jgi:RNA polymerase sigma-70 factor, ECF subfamily